MSNATSEIDSPPRLRRFQFTVRSLLVAMLLAALFFGTDGCGVIGLHYPRAVENDPLLAPVRVLSVQNNDLRLEDGRVLRVEQLMLEGSLKELLAASDNRVDLERWVEADGSQGSGYLVLVKKPAWICGTPWVRPFNLPLIPDNVPINRRVEVGYATEQANAKTMEKQQSR